MSLTCKEELNRTLRIVHNLRQTLKVGEEKVSTLVSSETAAETDEQCVWSDALKQRYHTRRITLVLQPCLTELVADIVNELLLQSHASLPYLVVGNIVDSLPNLLVALVRHEVCVEVLAIDILPLCGSPCREVYTVGYIAYMVLLWIVTVPD